MIARTNLIVLGEAWDRDIPFSATMEVSLLLRSLVFLVWQKFCPLASSSTLVKLPNQDSSYCPDIIISDRNYLSSEPLG
jgi:hypothetical protein